MLGVIERLQHDLHQALAQQLDAAYRRTLANFPTNAAIRVAQVNGRDTLTLTGLNKLVLISHRIDLQQPEVRWGAVSYKAGILSQCSVLLVK
jgi:hypothetical protein